MKANAISLSKGAVGFENIDVSKPEKDEVLVETKACGICMGDVYTFQGKLPGGQVMGHEGVGIVAEVGENVEGLKRGDKVTTLGGPAFVEFYKTVYKNVAQIPEDVEDYALWISEPLACAVNGIRGSEIQIGDDICVIGCGYMGLLLIQAMPKTIINSLVAFDIKEERLALAKKFGVGLAINPGIQDPTKSLLNFIGHQADIVIEASGAEGTLRLATELVSEGGKLVIFGRHVVDERLPTEKWHAKGLRILNTAPAFSDDFIKDFRDSVMLLKRGIFDQRSLMTHRFAFRDAQRAFEVASSGSREYIKGAICF